MSSEIILETEGLTKEFAGFVAVNGVNLKVERGTIHALIGPNGAGKTTCFNLLTKFRPKNVEIHSSRVAPKMKFAVTGCHTRAQRKTRPAGT